MKFTCLIKQDTPLYISGLFERMKCPMRAPGLASSATLSNLGPVKKADWGAVTLMAASTIVVSPRVSDKIRLKR